MLRLQLLPNLSHVVRLSLWAMPRCQWKSPLILSKPPLDGGRTPDAIVMTTPLRCGIRHNLAGRCVSSPSSWAFPSLGFRLKQLNDRHDDRTPLRPKVTTGVSSRPSPETQVFSLQ